MERRAESRRPISEAEVPGLLRLGGALRGLRTGVGLSQAKLGWAAEVSAEQVLQIEHGYRRTRRSTLTRLVEVLVAVDPALGEVGDLVDDLCDLAGAGLAAESGFAERVGRRRERRVRREDRIVALAERRAVELNRQLHKDFYARARLEAAQMLRDEERRKEGRR